MDLVTTAVIVSPAPVMGRSMKTMSIMNPIMNAIKQKSCLMKKAFVYVYHLKLTISCRMRIDRYSMSWSAAVCTSFMKSLFSPTVMLCSKSMMKKSIL